MSTTITFAGNLAANPELRFSTDGKAFANFTVLVNERYRDAEGNWQDAEPTRHRVAAAGALAENIAESLGTGDTVLVIGRIKTEAWADKDTGEKRTAQKVRADEVGASLRFSAIRTHKNDRTQQPERVEAPAE